MQQQIHKQKESKDSNAQKMSKAKSLKIEKRSEDLQNTELRAREVKDQELRE